jgi:hypothetical protein
VAKAELMAKPALSIRVTGPAEIKQRVSSLLLMFPQQLAAANALTAEEIKRDAQENLRRNGSIASGDLYQTIVVYISPGGMRVAVGSTSPYAPYVEFGTRPHMPPVDAIRRWCRLKGIPEDAAWPIALHIAAHGTPEQPFLYPAYLVGRSMHLARVEELLEAGLSRTLR